MTKTGARLTRVPARRVFPMCALLARAKTEWKPSLLSEHSPDLVFLDVQMPGLNGFGVIKKLADRKAKPPADHFPPTAFDNYAVQAFEVNADRLFAEALR